MRKQKRTAALMYSPRSLRFVPALLLAIVAASSHAGSNPARDAAGSRISVTAVGGDVDFTMAGNAVSVAPNSTVLLPARIVTGHDGNVGLTQAGTNISVSGDTDIEIPAEAVDGNLVARLVQHRGNVFYDVAPRDVGKLRVETPFLVAVIKGTQFNVAVEDGSTTISLFEGTLELRTPDDSDIVHLNAGEIAIRSLIDDSIRVVGMDDLGVAAPSPQASPAAGNDAAAPERGAAVADEAVAVRVEEGAVGGDTKAERPVVGRRHESTVVDVAVLTGIETTVDLLIDIDSEKPGAGVGRDRENTGLGLGHDKESRGVGLGRGTVELPVDLRLDTELDRGAPSVDVDVGADAGLDLGDALDGALDLGTVVDTVVTVDDGQIDLALDAVGDLNLDADLDLDLDLDADLHEDLDIDLDGDHDGDLSDRVEPPTGGLLGALP